MAWFHQYQYVEIVDPMYPQLRSKALPIVSYEMNSSENKILGVLVSLGPGNSIWFKRNQIVLFKSGTDLAGISHSKYSISKFSRFLRSLGIGGN